MKSDVAIDYTTKSTDSAIHELKQGTLKASEEPFFDHSMIWTLADCAARAVYYDTKDVKGMIGPRPEKA